MDHNTAVALVVLAVLLLLYFCTSHAHVIHRHEYIRLRDGSFVCRHCGAYHRTK